MLSGEVRRGLVFLGGAFISAILIGVAPTLSAVAYLAVDIISVIDAVRVAKVNDLAFRDKGKTSMLAIPIGSTHYIHTVGFTWMIRF
jgi:hypothetical protein